MVYEITDDGNLMTLKTSDPRYPNVIDIQWCAIGRSSPWPPMPVFNRECSKATKNRKDDGTQSWFNSFGYDS